MTTVLGRGRRIRRAGPPPIDVDAVLSRYRRYGPVFKPGDKTPVSGTFVCDRGTMLPPLRVQLTKGEEFPEAEGLGAHTRWRETNIQS